MKKKMLLIIIPLLLILLAVLIVLPPSFGKLPKGVMPRTTVFKLIVERMTGKWTRLKRNDKH